MPDPEPLPLTPLAALLDAAYDEFAASADRPMYHQTWMEFTADYLLARGVTLDAERAGCSCPGCATRVPDDMGHGCSPTCDACIGERAVHDAYNRQMPAAAEAAGLRRKTR